MLEKEAVLNVDRIFTVNHMLAEKISNDLKLPIQSVDWIPNAALPDRGQGKSNEYFRTFLAKYNRAILYNGSIVPDRNLDKVPELARHLEKYGIAVVVVGPGDFRAFSHIEVDNFFVLPALMPESMNSALKYFDAILFPNEPLNLNTQYCYPNKLGDALHAGLSLIVNEGLVFLESLVRAYEIGTIIDMKNLEKASVEIAKLLFSNHLGNRVEEANRAYGWNTFSTKYSAWIDRLPVNGEDIYPDIY